MFATRFVLPGIALLLSAGPPNLTEAATVRDLLKYCQPSRDGADYAYCLGVMAGAADMAAFAVGDDLVRDPLGTPGLDICLGGPHDHTPGDLADAFVAWATTYPSAGDWDEAFGLVAAFRAKWPCTPIRH
jgi:hypothetical protein